MPPQQTIVASNAGIHLTGGQTSSEASDGKTNMVAKSGSSVDLKDWGYPGYLTPSEYSIYEKFRDEIYSERRSDDFRSTIFSFQKANEEVPYALCRWLRARKFDLSATIKMIEEATQETSKARDNQFFPCPEKALQVESSVYLKQYPQLYYGHARNGCPVFISQPGLLDIDAIGCLTSITNIINFHWNAMMHDFVQKLGEEYKTSNGEFKRFECVCILDLAGLTPSKLGANQKEIVKTQSAIDSLCFPETLNKMVIVNAPSYFTLTWKLVRGWIDKRTASKVEVIGNDKAKMLKKFSTFIDPAQLPRDFGGNGTSIEESLRNDMLEMAESKRKPGSVLKLEEEDPCLMIFKGSKSKSFSVESGKEMKLSFLTRSLDGVDVIIKNVKSGETVATIFAKHTGKSETDTTEIPTRFELEDCGVKMHGPGRFCVELKSRGSRFKQVIFMMIMKTFAKDAPKPACPDDLVRDRPQAGDDSSYISESGSICTGTFAEDNSEVVTVLRSSLSHTRA